MRGGIEGEGRSYGDGRCEHARRKTASKAAGGGGRRLRFGAVGFSEKLSSVRPKTEKPLEKDKRRRGEGRERGRVNEVSKWIFAMKEGRRKQVGWLVGRQERAACAVGHELLIAGKGAGVELWM